LNLIKTALFIISKKPDLVYAYADKPMYIASPLKKFFKFKLIYDIRGDIIDEHKARGASKKKLVKLSKFHIKALNSVDLVFTVSNTYKMNSKAEFVPKFNYYDGDVFKYDEESMLKKKKELQLEGKFVFVYTGNTHYYQYLEGIVKFFSQFYENHKNSFLLIITEHDSSEFTSQLNKYNIPVSNYLSVSLPQNEISELQQAADMAFLLREDLPLNHHSFPTKFAEYLASGVPVLMTPHIYSIAPMVIKNGLGEVIKIKDDYSNEIEKIYSKYKNNLPIKNHCSQFAQTELMWQNKAISIFNIINKMIR
jgi:glycosyltransferase involved in cell wall biosynthesis